MKCHAEAGLSVSARCRKNISSSVIQICRYFLHLPRPHIAKLRFHLAGTVLAYIFGTMRVEIRLLSRSALLPGLVAVIVLFAGLWIYAAERGPQATLFLAAINFSQYAPSIFGALGGSLPTFAHVFAFSIFTALIIGQTSRAALYASLTWFFIDISFEIGQHAAVAPSVASALSPIGSFTSYFTAGTFDPLDMASIGVGAALAYIFVSASFVSHKSTAALKKLQ